MGLAWVVSLGCAVGVVVDDGGPSSDGLPPIGDADAGDDSTGDHTDTATSDTGTNTGDGGQDGTDAGDDTPTDTGDDTPTDTGDDTPTDTGDDTPTDTGDDTPTDTGDDTPTDTGDDTPTDTGDDTPTDTGDDAPTDTGDDTPTDTGDDTPTDTDPPGGTETVKNHDGSCESTLWCTSSGVGAGPHAAMECFSSVGLTPPYDLTTVAYSIRNTGEASSSVSLVVRGWNGSSVGTVVGTRSLSVSDINTGSHTVAVDPPIAVNQSGFCVAIEANGAFAMNMDLAYQTPNHSWLKVPNCAVSSYATTASLGQQPGNWCITAEVEN